MIIEVAFGEPLFLDFREIKDFSYKIIGIALMEFALMQKYESIRIAAKRSAL